MDIRLCLYTRDVKVDNVIRTVKLASYSKRVACITKALDRGLLCPQVASAPELSWNSDLRLKMGYFCVATIVHQSGGVSMLPDSSVFF